MNDSSLPTTTQNTSFSSLIPGLQLAVDSTSLGQYKTCPRLYYYSIVLGWRPRRTSVHLTFGLLAHGFRERYDHRRAAGDDHDSALRMALLWALKQTWVPGLGRGWVSGDPNKNRLTLLRTMIWYHDQYRDDPCETVVLANGKPAVELSFSFNSGYSTIGGESYLLCGHMDKIGQMNGTAYIHDLKTTKHALSSWWFEQFTPGNQFSTYTLAGQVVWHEPIAGLIVDGVQVLVNGARFERGLVPRPQAVVEEWHQGLGKWLLRMELSAKEGASLQEAGKDPVQGWPMNDTACDRFGGCDFRPVCSRSPASRSQWLETDYVKRIWDPLQRRGDV